ncbi:hypothetical protein BP5796_00081 [Coleophoma crateriformis]|uniref:Peptidase A1 domain-containing protein n=1 Tax=Coleophoma crateriformis TaxID=565419 RepID=A0A3D8T8J0_9HELO|nr:hypothetical protein BP5796_00081 [Coleophoma crateriformis]
MRFLALLALVCALLSSGDATRPAKPELLVARGIKAKGFQARSEDTNASAYISMTRASKQWSTSHINAYRKRDFGSGIAPTYAIQQAQSWFVNLTVAGKEYALLLDTGSSDTWIASEGFQCLDLHSATPIAEANCAFGPLYSPGKEFKPIANENFNITYGGGEFLTGTFGNTQVTLGGISVTQQIASVTGAGWDGDGISSGMIGFAYPPITFGYNGTDPHNDVPASQIPYNPLFTTLYKSGKISPVFSLAISRPFANSRSCMNGKSYKTQPADGYLALGGLPLVSTTGRWATSPIQYVALGAGYLNGSLPYPQYQFYTITPDSFLYKDSHKTKYKANQWSPLPNPANSSQVQVMLDSGTTLNYIPTEMSYALAALYEPPAVWNDKLGAFSVDCNATPPDFAVKISGVDFSVDKRDMILDDNTGNGTCIAGNSDGMNYPPYILGDVFMKNALVVFDVGAGELRFRSR